MPTASSGHVKSGTQDLGAEIAAELTRNRADTRRGKSSPADIAGPARAPCRTWPDRVAIRLVAETGGPVGARLEMKPNASVPRGACRPFQRQQDPRDREVRDRRMDRREWPRSGRPDMITIHDGCPGDAFVLSATGRLDGPAASAASRPAPSRKLRPRNPAGRNFDPVAPVFRRPFRAFPGAESAPAPAWFRDRAEVA